MKDYIEREAVLELLRKWADGYSYIEIEAATAIRGITAIPAADVKPVVRGEWIGYPECLKYTNAYSDDHIVYSACEECFSILDNDCERFNFCPNCGSYNGGDGDDQH